MSPCATPSDDSAAPSPWRSVKTSGSLVVSCASHNYGQSLRTIRNTWIECHQSTVSQLDGRSLT